MSENMDPSEEVWLTGIEIAFKSNDAHDRLRESIAKLEPFNDGVVDGPASMQAYREVMQEISRREKDFHAYSAAAGVLLMPGQAQIVLTGASASFKSKGRG